MRTIIVGGGACGASAAARLRRLDEKAEIVILEATEEVSIANCGLPYYCSDVICDREKVIIAKPMVFIDTLNIDLRFKSKVTSIDRANKKVRVNDEYDLPYDKLILAMGAAPIKPPIEGINNKNVFTVRTLVDADKIKDYAKTNHVCNAVVIGAGFVGVEMAENFVEMGFNTTLVELAPQILAPVDEEIAVFAQNEMRNHGCRLILNNGVKRFGDNEIELNNGDKIPYDMAILAIGVKPGTEIAKEAGLELGLNNSIKVNDHMQTSDPDIYAGGDSVEIVDFVTREFGLIPLAGPANRQGRIIADNICGRDQTYRASQGTAAIKVFNKTVAAVGKNERQLKKAGTKYLKNIIQSTSHSAYYPDAGPLFVKLLFTEEGKILGAQAVGTNGTEKRIDVIATIMRLNGTLQDMIDAELCYAPPYSSAKDAVNILGMSSMNIIEKIHKPAFYEDIDGSFLVFIKAKTACMFDPPKGALVIPAEELRNRLDEIPRDKKVILLCQKGFNSYTANRILIQNGFDNTYSLAAGLYIYNEIEKDKKGLASPA